MVKIPETKPSTAATQEIPSWIKNNAGWWADDKISDDEFVSAIQLACFKWNNQSLLTLSFKDQDIITKLF